MVLKNVSVEILVAVIAKVWYANISRQTYMDVYTALGSFEFVTLHIGRVLHVHIRMRIRTADQNKSIKFETGQVYHQYSK